MGKNGAGAALAAKPKAGKAKKNGHHKPKRGSMFKALKKQEHRVGVVQTDKAAGAKSAKTQKPVAMRRSAISSEFRSFDERMAGQKAKQQQRKALGGTKQHPVIAPPTFVVAAPTFQLNAAAQPSAAPRPDTKGFEGFLSAMQAPRDVRPPAIDHAARRPKPTQPPQYSAQNVFAVLGEDEGDGRALPPAPAPAPAFIQPATFSFAPRAVAAIDLDL